MWWSLVPDGWPDPIEDPPTGRVLKAMTCGSAAFDVWVDGEHLGPAAG